jgi:hypothetical protein
VLLTEVVTIGDVLVAVYRAVRDWVVERHGEFGGSAALKGEADLTVRPSSASQGEGYIEHMTLYKLHENLDSRTVSGSHLFSGTEQPDPRHRQFFSDSRRRKMRKENRDRQMDRRRSHSVVSR